MQFGYDGDAAAKLAAQLCNKRSRYSMLRRLLAVILFERIETKGGNADPATTFLPPEALACRRAMGQAAGAHYRDGKNVFLSPSNWYAMICAVLT